MKIKATIKRETPKAYLIEAGGKETWLPRSQVQYDSQTGEATLPDWLAAKSGITQPASEQSEPW